MECFPQSILDELQNKPVVVLHKMIKELAPLDARSAKLLRACALLSLGFNDKARNVIEGCTEKVDDCFDLKKALADLVIEQVEDETRHCIKDHTVQGFLRQYDILQDTLLIKSSGEHESTKDSSSACESHCFSNAIGIPKSEQPRTLRSQSPMTHSSEIQISMTPTMHNEQPHADSKPSESGATLSQGSYLDSKSSTPIRLTVDCRQALKGEEPETNLVDDFVQYAKQKQPGQSLGISPPDTCTASSIPFVPSTHGEERERECFDEFYSFVVLHHPDDSEVAVRTKDRLEELTEGHGAVFCENFQIAGKAFFSSLEEAIDNSAFGVLLLTSNFNSTLTNFITQAVLMAAIENKNSHNVVIPFLPLHNRIRKVPFSLKVINPLDEQRQYFKKQVKITLSKERVKKHYDNWLKEKEAKLSETLMSHRDAKAKRESSGNKTRLKGSEEDSDLLMKSCASKDGGNAAKEKGSFG
uniref:TIR domain-containing adapter molecule 1-like isoform X2 n=1 Tax=Myxine glutinosa TaxID=7769 RepID=UPI00358EBF93